MTTFNWNFFHRKFEAILFISIPTLLSPPDNELRGAAKNMKTTLNDFHFMRSFTSAGSWVWSKAKPVQSSGIFSSTRAKPCCFVNLIICIVFFSISFPESIANLCEMCFFSQISKISKEKMEIPTDRTIFRSCGRECDSMSIVVVTALPNAYC